MRNRERLRGDLLVLETCMGDLAILKTRHTLGTVREVRVKLTKQGHVIRHLTGRVHFPSQDALNQLAGIL